MSAFWSSQRERISQWGLFRTLGYYAFGVAGHKAGIWLTDSFELPAQPRAVAKSPEVTFDIVGSMAAWTARDLESLRACEGISLLPLYPGFFAAGDQCAVARWRGDELACVCWMHRRSDYPLANGNPIFLIQYCFTLPGQRGKGLYPQTLAHACSSIRGGSEPLPIFIDCSTFNYASKRGIHKAGFQLVGRILRAFGRTWNWRMRSAS